jgi:L,D-transpeptidase catalytic domain
MRSLWSSHGVRVRRKQLSMAADVNSSETGCGAVMRLVQLAVVTCSLFSALQRAEAAVTINVDLSKQEMHVSTSSGEEHVWPISSARPGYRTPTGTYHSQQLQRMHYSKKYDNAPMPYSIFFSGGYAIHATDAVRKLGRPASHGCIRLSLANAEHLFGLVRAEGAVISITRSPGTSAARSLRQKQSNASSINAPYPPLWAILATR